MSMLSQSGRDPNQENDPLEDLSPKERKKYRERVRYWHKEKGFPIDRAKVKARENLRLVSSQPNLFDIEIAQNDYDENEAEKTESSIIHLPSKGQKDKFFCHCMAGCPDSKASFTPDEISIRQQNSVKPATEEQKVNFSASKDIISACLFFIPVAAISALLIDASLDVFGHNNWQGWLKAVSLEIGILYLSLSSSQSRLTAIAKKSVAFAMVVLSFSVLHAGANQETNTKLSNVSSSNKNLQILESQRDQLLKSIDHLPVNYTTKRAEGLKKLEALDLKILSGLNAVKDSKESSVINNIGQVEVFLRFCLIVLNLFFCHAFVERLIVAMKSLQKEEQYV